MSTVGPTRGLKEVEKLRSCYRNCLKFLEDHDELRTIAFPAISTGMYGIYIVLSLILYPDRVMSTYMCACCKLRVPYSGRSIRSGRRGARLAGKGRQLQQGIMSRVIHGTVVRTIDGVCDLQVDRIIFRVDGDAYLQAFHQAQRVFFPRGDNSKSLEQFAVTYVFICGAVHA